MLTFVLLAMILAFTTLTPAHARSSASEDRGFSHAYFNVPTPTLGGLQFWADVHYDNGWRIQRNAVTGHYRLLDDYDIRRAWGSRKACEEALPGFENEADSAEERHAVVMLHGFMRSRKQFLLMKRDLEKAGFEPIPVQYASTRDSLEGHGEHLSDLLDDLKGYDQVSFVTYSMGGVVLRQALDLTGSWDNFETGRIIMIAPPSNGSELATRFHSKATVKILGPSFDELATTRLEDLPPPAEPFAIVMGGRGNDKGYNPMISGDDDGVVTTEDVRLEDAEIIYTVNQAHTMMTWDPKISRLVVRYLTGEI